MKFQYRPRGVCSQLMDIEVEDGRIVNVNVTGGCPGNLHGISRLLKGMSVDDAIERMDGIRCGMKPPPPVDFNLYEAPVSALQTLPKLPGSLEDAVYKMTGSEFVRQNLPRCIMEAYRRLTL